MPSRWAFWQASWLAGWLPVAPDNQQPAEANEDPLQLSDLGWRRRAVGARLSRVERCRPLGSRAPGTRRIAPYNSLALSLATGARLFPSHVELAPRWRRKLLVSPGAS